MANMDIWQGKKMVVFDLDKTLSKSKQTMDEEMAGILRSLMERFLVAVISGGSYAQFQKQVLPPMLPGPHLKNFYLFPTCGSAFYRYGKDGWEEVYTEKLAPEEKKRIFEAFPKMFEEVGFRIPEPLYGILIEDRESQITFAACGSDAPLAIKSVWDPDRNKRLKMIEVLYRFLPEFELRTGGSNSIDVTRKGIDKAYGIKQMEKHLGLSRNEILFIGDDLGPGGNDAPVKDIGVDCVSVVDEEETKRILREVIAVTPPRQ